MGSGSYPPPPPRKKKAKESFFLGAKQCQITAVFISLRGRGMHGYSDESEVQMIIFHNGSFNFLSLEFSPVFLVEIVCK